MKTIYLVTGACGHLGNTIVRELLFQGKQVRALLMPEERTQALQGLNVEVYRGDVRQKDSLLDFFTVGEGVQTIVIHTAGIVSVASKGQAELEAVNVDGTKNVIALCEEFQVAKLLYISSVHAIPEQKNGQVMTEIKYFRPDDVVGPYAKTKAKATQLVLEAEKRGLNAVVLHPSGMIGPNDYGKGHLTQMLEEYLNGRLTACLLGGYDFVDVRDVAHGILLAAEKGRSGECYILSNRYFSAVDILNRVHEISGRQKIRMILPNWFLKATAPLAETYYRVRHISPLFTKYTLYTLASNSNFSAQKAKRELGYQTREMTETLTATLLFLQQQGRVRKAFRYMQA